MEPEADQQDPQSTVPEPVDLASLATGRLDIELVDPVSVDPASVDLVALQAGAAPAGDADAAAGLPPAAPTVTTAKPAKRRAGVPVWRTGKPDAFLAAAVDTARTAIAGITSASDIGPHLAVKSEGDRLVTHLFECRLPGYVGWQWFAVLTRNSRSKVVTVNELGLLASEESILAPEWVPWAERVRPEDEQEPEPETPGHQAFEPAAEAPASDEPASVESAEGVAASLDAVGLNGGQGGGSQDGERQQGEERDAEAPVQTFNHNAGTT